MLVADRPDAEMQPAVAVVRAEHLAVGIYVVVGHLYIVHLD